VTLNLDPGFNRRIVERLRTAVVGCNLNHVPQTLRRVLETGAWRERWEVNIHWKFDKFRDFITASPVDGGMGWKPKLVEGLLLKAEDPDALELWYKAMRADDAHELDAQDQANVRPAHRPAKTLYDKDKVVQGSAPTGNRTEAALRRLRHASEDGDERVAAIYQRVLDGEITAHAGMIEAGFRTKQPSRKMTALDQLNRWWKKASEEQRAEFLNDKS
jgi:hypothetical protein